MLHLIRYRKSPDGLFGCLALDGHPLCLTLERDDTFIRPGEYPVRPFSSQKHPNTYEILIPGHTAVLFHAGNTEDDSQGCILLGIDEGEVKGKQGIIRSREAVTMFKKAMSGRAADTLVVEEAL